MPVPASEKLIVRPQNLFMSSYYTSKLSYRRLGRDLFCKWRQTCDSYPRCSYPPCLSPMPNSLTRRSPMAPQDYRRVAVYTYACLHFVHCILPNSPQTFKSRNVPRGARLEGAWNLTRLILELCSYHSQH